VCQGRLPSGHETEQHSRRNYQQRTEREDPHIWRCVDHQRCSPARCEPHKAGCAPAADHETGYSTENSKQHSFGDELPHYAGASGSECELETHLRLTSGGSRKKKMGDVDTGDEKQKSHASHEHD
jgi:hypothetical protein